MVSKAQHRTAVQKTCLVLHSYPLGTDTKVEGVAPGDDGDATELLSETYITAYYIPSSSHCAATQ